MTARRLTPPGPGAVAVVEISGASAASSLAELGLVELPQVGEIQLVRPRAGGELLDEALLLSTGEGSYELHLHASPPLLAEMLERLGAGEDEPPRSVEEAALRAVPHAHSELGARVLLAQAGGALRRDVHLLAGAGSPDTAEFFRRGELFARLEAPLRVVLTGAVNSGKSTLFNVLAGEERATVSQEEGTTRDALVARCSFGPYPVDLIDTAGARDLPLDAGGSMVVEREGQDLARRLASVADLELVLVPAGEPAPQLAGSGRQLVIWTMGDLHPREGAVSALRDPVDAAARVSGIVLEALGLPGQPIPDTSQGVPFGADLIEGLREALGKPAGPLRDDALASWLGPSSLR